MHLIIIIKLLKFQKQMIKLRRGSCMMLLPVLIIFLVFLFLIVKY